MSFTFLGSIRLASLTFYTITIIIIITITIITITIITTVSFISINVMNDAQPVQLLSLVPLLATVLLVFPTWFTGLKLYLY